MSRSTFYTHYSDKNDLFMGDVDQFWEGMASLLSRRREASNRVAPVRELFAHVAERQDFYAALVASGGSAKAGFIDDNATFSLAISVLRSAIGDHAHVLRIEADANGIEIQAQDPHNPILAPQPQGFGRVFATGNIT